MALFQYKDTALSYLRSMRNTMLIERRPVGVTFLNNGLPTLVIRCIYTILKQVLDCNQMEARSNI